MSREPRLGERVFAIVDGERAPFVVTMVDRGHRLVGLVDEWDYDFDRHTPSVVVAWGDIEWPVPFRPSPVDHWQGRRRPQSFQAPKQDPAVRALARARLLADPSEYTECECCGETFRRNAFDDHPCEPDPDEMRAAPNTAAGGSCTFSYALEQRFPTPVTLQGRSWN